MIRRLCACTAALAVAASPAAAQPPGNILSIDQLLSVESVVSGAPEWAPDGLSILFQSSLNGGLMTIPPDGGFPTRVPVEMGGSGHFLASQMPGWSPNGRWISYVSDKSGSPEIWLWSTYGGTDVQLTDLGGRINSMSWSPDERWIAFAGDRYGNYDIWKVEVATGRVQRLTTGKGYEVFPTWTPDSEAILYVRLDDTWEHHDVIEIDPDGGGARTVLSDRDFFDYGAGATFGYPAVSPDGAQILFRSHRSGWINYWLAPRAGGEPRPIAAAEADQSGAVWSPDGNWIAYTENHNGHHDLRVVSPDGGKPRVLASPALEGAFGGRSAGGVTSNPAWSPDSRSISYLMADLVTPQDLHVVSVEDGESRQLTRSRTAGDYQDWLIVPEKIHYESTDGYSIPAYLYRPREGAGGAGAGGAPDGLAGGAPDGLAGGGAEAQTASGAPGLLWIHGGPTSQFNDTFQQHVQYFAQRGYVVLLPNIRGSSGYGKAFADANNECWGHCDLEDVLAGVDYLKTLPGVDPDRMGLTGTSYGGVMSMYAAAFAPDVFRAIIPGSGYGDWVHFYHVDNELRHVKLLEHELGPFDTHEHVWRNSSAIYEIDQVSAPIFLVHGVGRYPGSDQSELFAKALENRYKRFRYTTYPNENYYVRGKASRRQMLLDMEDFLNQYLRDDKVDAGERGEG